MAEEKKWFNTNEINPPHGLPVLTCNLDGNREAVEATKAFIKNKGISTAQVIEALYYPVMIATHKFIEGKHYFLMINPEGGGIVNAPITHWQYLPKSPDNLAFNKNN